MSDESKPVNGKTTITPEDLIDHLRKGKKIHDEFATQFRKLYQVSGRLVEEWKQYFHLDMPPDLTPAICQQLDAQLMDLYQEASFMKAVAEIRLIACKNTDKDFYREKYAAMVAEYNLREEKLPAAATLATMAEYNISDLKYAVVHSEIELAFWKEILNDLYNCRKVIDNATINLSVEAKALQQERIIDHLNLKDR